MAQVAYRARWFGSAPSYIWIFIALALSSGGFKYHERFLSVST